jgi:O-antigen/teichoic acid export membrane protein
MIESLQKKAITGLAWSTLERFCQQLLQFVLAVLLARLLQPSEFGLIAMVSFFIAVSQTFVDSGFGSALVQKQNVTHLDECSVFFFNLAMGCLATAVLFAIAPWIANFYSQPPLKPVIRCLSFLLLINSLGVIQHRVLLKQMNFKALFRVNAISFPLAGGLGVSLAYCGFGIWSFVAQQLCYGSLNAILLWYFVGWRPSWMFSLQSLRSLFGFGSKILATGMLETMFQHMYELVIGKAYTPELLGYYSRARSTQQLLSSNLYFSVNRVTFPVFSSIQNDLVQMRSGVRRGLCYLGMINFPFMIGLAVVAEPLVEVVYTAKWLPSVTYLQLLCVVGLLHPLSAINSIAITALGRSDLTLRLEIIKKGVAVLLLACTWQLGLLPMIIGQIIVAIFGYFIHCFYTSKLIGYSMQQQFWDLLPALSLSLTMGALVTAIGWYDYTNPFVQLVTQTISGVLAFALLCRISVAETYKSIDQWALTKLGGFRTATHTP